MSGVRVLSIVLLAACTEPAPATQTSRVEVVELPAPSQRQLDLLMVIDRSPAMRDHVDVLAPRWHTVTDALQTLDGGLPSLHLAVTTADLGTSDAFGRTGPTLPGCSATGDNGRFRGSDAITGTFLVDDLLIDGTRSRNYDGRLADRFAELAEVGSDGCSIAQPLEAMRRSLLRADQRDFVRPDAQLVVAIVTAQDDRSLADARTLAPMPIDGYVRVLRDDKPDPLDLIVTAQRAGGDRLGAWLAAFSNRSTSIPIDGDPSGLVQQLAGFGVPDVANPCLTSTVDEDTCVAWYRFADAARGEQPIAPCSSHPDVPCWRIVDDALQCPAAPTRRLEIRHASYQPRGTWVHAECVVQ